MKLAILESNLLKILNACPTVDLSEKGFPELNIQYKNSKEVGLIQPESPLKASVNFDPFYVILAGLYIDGA